MDKKFNGFYLLKKQNMLNRTIGRSREWNIAKYGRHNCQFIKMATWSVRKVLKNTIIFFIFMFYLFVLLISIY